MSMSIQDAAHLLVTYLLEDLERYRPRFPVSDEEWQFLVQHARSANLPDKFFPFFAEVVTRYAEVEGKRGKQWRKQAFDYAAGGLAKKLALFDAAKAFLAKNKMPVDMYAYDTSYHNPVKRPSVGELVGYLSQFKNKKELDTERESAWKANVLVDDENWFIMVPKSHADAVRFAHRYGRCGTKWCISVSGDEASWRNYYEDFRGHFVFVYDKRSNRKYSVSSYSAGAIKGYMELLREYYNSQHIQRPKAEIDQIVSDWLQNVRGIVVHDQEDNRIDSGELKKLLGADLWSLIVSHLKQQGGMYE